MFAPLVPVSITPVPWAVWLPVLKNIVLPLVSVPYLDLSSSISVNAGQCAPILSLWYGNFSLKLTWKTKLPVIDLYVPNGSENPPAETSYKLPFPSSLISSVPEFIFIELWNSVVSCILSPRSNPGIDITWAAPFSSLYSFLVGSTQNVFDKSLTDL